MAKILVLYYSMYGHIETLASAIAEGAKKVNGVEVTIKRVPETMPPDAFANAGGKTNQQAPVATPQNWQITMVSFLVRQPVSVIWQGKCAPSLIKPAGYGLLAHCSAKLPVCSPPPVLAAGKSTPSPPRGPH